MLNHDGNPATPRTSLQSSTHRSSTSTPASIFSNSTATAASTLSVLSVPLMDPYYRELQYLKADHATLQQKLKLTQQTLQGSYQDLAVAQERSKRAEAESGRLRAQMDRILKNHVDHHPERQALVQQLAELQSRLELEIGSRKAQGQEHAALQHEILRFKLKNATATTTIASTTVANSTAAAATQASASPSFSPTSVRSSPFTSFWRGNHRKNKSSVSTDISCATSVKSAFVADTEDISILQGSSKRPQNQGGERAGDAEIMSAKEIDQRKVAHQPHQLAPSTLEATEAMEAQRKFCETLQEENVAMKMELQDLRYRRQAEKNSIREYMSLFESLQKKQVNALAVAQAEIDLLHANISDIQVRLESRDQLLKTLSTTVIQTQAADFEQLTRQSCREQILRAKTEQEMASLLEASLLMLERFFHNVEQTRLKVEQVMGPVRQTIQILEVPSIVEEWEHYEIAVQGILIDLERSLMKQQELQELELTMESGETKVNNNRASKAYLWAREHRRSISSAHSVLSTSKSTTSGNSFEQDSMPVLDNSHSQRVFLWRRCLADAFLEECVKSVEDLAQQKKELQIRVVELMHMAAGQDKEHSVDVQEPKTSSIEETKPPGENLSSKESDAAGRHGVSEEAAPSDKAESKVQATAPVNTNLAAQIMRTQRLKAILKQAVEWIDLPAQSKNNLSAARKSSAPEITMDIEDEIMSLCISDVSSMSAETNCIATASVEHDVKAEAKYLETLLQLIRDELSDNPSSTTSAGEVTEAEASTSSSSPLPSLSAAKSLQSGESNDLDIATNTNRIRTRPENIMTHQPDPIHPPSCTSTLSSTSTSSYFSSSSSSGRFPRINIGGVSIPSSPSLGGLVCGPDGKPVLDVDALCRDLAFRSFPKQHQWSKSRRSIQTETTPLHLLKGWSSTATGGISNMQPPLPPARNQ